MQVTDDFVGKVSMIQASDKQLNEKYSRINSRQACEYERKCLKKCENLVFCFLSVRVRQRSFSDTVFLMRRLANRKIGVDVQNTDRKVIAVVFLDWRLDRFQEPRVFHVDFGF